MNRTEAIIFVKKIQTICEAISPTAVKLTEPNPNNTFSIGYQISISGFFDNDWLEKIKEIAKKDGLSVTVGNGEVIIYKPKN